MDNEQELWELEKKFWRGSAEFYANALTEDALMVFPGMALAKAATVDSINASARWVSVDFKDRRIVRLTDDAILLHYKASARRAGNDKTYEPLCTSGHVNRGGVWKLAFHQQTPEPAA
ncbi:MAG: nuclear transport factor 2 family protein [Acidobacteriota bacterium]